MTDAPVQTAVTLDDLMKMDWVEIINGEIVPMTAAGAEHHIIGQNFNRVIDRFVIEHEVGIVFFDGMTYLMYANLPHLKDSFVPDVSFIRNDNIPPNWDIEKPHPGAPNLAIEIVSPGDDAEDIQAKIRTYFEKGTEQVWIAYPRTKEVHQHIRDSDHIRVYNKPPQAIATEALFPGLVLTLEMIFRLPPWAIKE